MRTWQEIKKAAQRNDWSTVAALAGCSSKNVKLVVNEERTDNFKIQKIFSELLDSRERLTKRHGKSRNVAQAA